MNLNPLSWYRFRSNLVVVRRIKAGSSLKLYKNPDTGEYYVSLHRYHPIMTYSLRNNLEDPERWV